jgi:membrane peptidoglycan carboxypeptidase
MPSVTQIIRMRRRRRRKYHHTPIQRSGFGVVLILCLSIIIAGAGVVLFYSKATYQLPPIESIPILLEPPDGVLLQPTRFYDRSGAHVIHVVENPTIQERTYYSLGGEDFSSGNMAEPQANIANSTISISDPSFLEHPGFSARGIQENTHETLAQRLVSDLLLWDEKPSIWRAVRERLLAAQITHRYGHEKVMEWYLNSRNYGNLVYGLEAASKVYFDKPAHQLNLIEAAILAAVAESPALNPLDSPQIAIERGHIVIDAMYGQGFISFEESIKAKSTGVKFQEPGETKKTLAPAFNSIVWSNLSKTIPIERIERGGVEVITSLDYELQVQSICTTEIHLTRIGMVNSHPENQAGDLCPASQLLPTLNIAEELTYTNVLATNIVILDPQSGEILALVGDFSGGKEKPTIDRHNPGTLLTPFVYLTAFTRGFSPGSLVWDIPPEQPDIYSELTDQVDEYFGPVRLRYALANDYLIPAVNLINQIGSENIIKTARQLGLNSLSESGTNRNATLCPGCKFVLKGEKISILEAVQSFGVFANQGVLVGQPSEKLIAGEIQSLLPVSILEVKDTSNQVPSPELETEARPVISNQLAYLMTHVLSDEAARWPSLKHPNPLEIGRPAGAKMGKTQLESDAWTVGFIPQLVVGVWMGVPDSGEIISIPTKYTSALWHALIQYAAQRYPAENWTSPPGVTSIEVCDPSGMLPTLQCPTIVSEVFLTGQEPTQPDILYQAFQVNRETERLATIFTPPELIEDRIYMNIPPEAKTWAESIDMETPPDTYDQIYTPEIDSNVRIDSPGMLDHIMDEVVIQGSATGPGFESFRLQAGAGINPPGWTVITEESNMQVESGTLGTWDTSGLNGLYALQLIVLRSDQSVDTATIQVTIDNLPPSVGITYPNNSQILSPDTERTITFLVDASDNVSLSTVEFFLDEWPIATLIQPPFAFPWQSRKGEYTLSVIATDFAGNSSEATISFSVE